MNGDGGLEENGDGSKAERGIGKERLLSCSVYCKPTILLRERLWRLWSRETRDEDTGTRRAVEGRKASTKKRRGSPTTLRAHHEIARGKGGDRRERQGPPRGLNRHGVKHRWHRHTHRKIERRLSAVVTNGLECLFRVSGQRRVTCRNRVTRTRNFSRKARGEKENAAPEEGCRDRKRRNRKAVHAVVRSLCRCDTLYRSNRSHYTSTHQNVTNVYWLRNICDRFVLGHTLNRGVVTYRNTYRVPMTRRVLRFYCFNISLELRLVLPI